MKSRAALASSFEILKVSKTAKPAPRVVSAPATPGDLSAISPRTWASCRLTPATLLSPSSASRWARLCVSSNPLPRSSFFRRAESSSVRSWARSASISKTARDISGPLGDALLEIDPPRLKPRRLGPRGGEAHDVTIHDGEQLRRQRRQLGHGQVLVTHDQILERLVDELPDDLRVAGQQLQPRFGPIGQRREERASTPDRSCPEARDVAAAHVRFEDRVNLRRR